ncbi:SOS response-associated peptidase family protein [Rhizobium sp. TH2]|nr:SOS response-associated peptidase family protein [Rhizobium sp. TH2]
MFNARIETIATSRSFKDSFEARRCLIPADGFYEWTLAPEVAAVEVCRCKRLLRLACIRPSIDIFFTSPN